MRPPIEPVVLFRIEDFDGGDRPLWIGGHFHQHLLQACRQIGNAKARKGLSGARRAEEQLIGSPNEEQAEVPGGAVVGVRRGCRSASELQGQSRRDEIDTYPVRWLSEAARADFTVELVHRKPLMLQQLTYLYVNVLTKIGDRCLR